MRSNPLKRQLAEGGHAFGTMIFEFFTPGIAQICKAAGAQFILYDMEHSAVDIGAMKEQFALCRGLGIAPMVRVPATQYHFIARMLDAGAFAIMVPMVESVEQAKEIVAATRYPPRGRRGAAFGMAHDDYEGGAVADKIAAANDRTMVICLIETPRGVENVDAIAAVDGVDVCWLGHFDLTNFMGIPGQFENPSYLAAVDKIVAACKRHGRTPGFMAADEAWSSAYLAKGFRMVAYGVDSALLQRELARGITALAHEARSNRETGND
jgi:2-dehydro-3-deoxyglucarate aldolase/4-hydroxy-2-oxoheptanedioate aldolase